MVSTIIAYIFIIFFGFILLWLILSRIVRKLVHFPAPSWIGKLLDSSYRRFLQRPETIIRRSGFKPGMKVLEVGCGSGAYTPFIARAIGAGGEVFALDVQKRMLVQIERKLRRPEWSDIKNITFIEASAYSIPLKDNFLDLVYMITVLPEIPDRNRALKEIKRVLKPGGMIAVSEFFPDPDYPLKSTTKKIIGNAGFLIESAEGKFWTYTVKGKKEK